MVRGLHVLRPPRTQCRLIRVAPHLQDGVQRVVVHLSTLRLRAGPKLDKARADPD